MRFFLPLIVIWLMSVAANSQGIPFSTGSFEELRTKARNENKRIFIDAYTTWCGPCKVMARTVFPDSAVGVFFDSAFVSAKIDMEKGEGVTVGEKYRVNCYPTFLFLDSSGALLHRYSGMLNVQDFLATANDALSAEKSFSAIEKKYLANRRDSILALEYIRAGDRSCLPENEMALGHLRALHEKELLESGNWNIFHQYVDDVHSLPFTYFLTHRNEFAARYGLQKVDDKIFQAYEFAVSGAAAGNETTDEALASLRNEIDRLEFGRREELQLHYDLAVSARNSRWAEHYNAARALVRKYRGSDYDFLNSVSYTLFEHSHNKDHLAEALLWAKKSVDIRAEPYNLDTYACLLWKNGRKSEAIRIQKRAIGAAKAAGEDTTQLEETLRKIENSRG